MQTAYLCTGTSVHIEGLIVSAYVGWGTKERSHSQNVRIDILLELDEASTLDERLQSTVDYVPVAEAVRLLAATKRRRLIETLAEEIAETCFRNANTQRATVSVRKPQKLPNSDAVGITRTFIRKGGA
ncbi:MAG: dihydroneopterin aldolase [Patescibacteria group bacterium]